MSMPFKKSQFKSMVITIGLECAEKQLGQRKETLSKDFDILKNIKCKGGSPALLPMRVIEGKAYSRGQAPSETGVIERDIEGKETKLQKEINDQKEKSVLEKAEAEKLRKKNNKNEQEDEMLE